MTRYHALIKRVCLAQCHSPKATPARLRSVEMRGHFLVMREPRGSQVAVTRPANVSRVSDGGEQLRDAFILSSLVAWGAI